MIGDQSAGESAAWEDGRQGSVILLSPCGLSCFIFSNTITSVIEGAPPYPFSVSPLGPSR